jgi:predicted TIM-barrel fold metal-dependent hydrolase
MTPAQADSTGPPGSTGPADAAGPPVIVDAHRHAWDLRQFRYPWLTGDGSLPLGLPACYLEEGFRQDAGGVAVLGSVLVEAGRDDAAADAQWLAGVAAGAGPLTAVVARAELERDDAGSQLAALAATGRIRGARQVLNYSAEPAARPSYAASRPDLMTDPAWRRGLGLVRDAGLSFDLQVEPHQLAAASRLAADFGDLQFVLDHGGYMTRRSAETDRLWRAGLKVLAAEPNVAVKASDYSTVDPGFDSAGYGQFVGELLEAFGPRRTLFASNFPAERLTISYARLAEDFGRAIEFLPDAERRAVWAGNAIALYRLGPPAGPPHDLSR